MKLLIVEDEQGTREGLKTMLDRESIGIREIYTAANGQQGLQKAQMYHPDIVLTDIRMPVMDGLTMSEKILDILPDCCIIFLSAYSEVSYYQKALRLKVIGYVEKPIMPGQLLELMKLAVKENVSKITVKTLQKNQRQKELSELALRLAHQTPGARPDTETERIMKQTGVSLYPYVTTVIIQINGENGPLGVEARFYEKLHSMEKALDMRIACTRKDSRDVILQWFGRKSELTSDNRTLFCEKVRMVLAPEEKYYIMFGNTLKDVNRAWESYRSAAALRQQSFYETYDTFTGITKKKEGLQSRRYQIEKEQILNAIEEMQKEKVLVNEALLFQNLENNRDSAMTYVMDLYISFYYAIYQQLEHHNPDHAKAEGAEESWGGQAERKNLQELHSFFIMLAERLFVQKEQGERDCSAILLIKNYIHENYQNPYLSLKEISDYVHVSNSHMCMLFKKETGITINQYLTDTRMNKAKRLLREGRLSVTEISIMTGYKDSSYFGKNFRRNFGMTPLEYRENWNESDH